MKIVSVWMYAVLAGILMAGCRPDQAYAENLQVDLPYGIGSVQLPWASTEVLTGGMKPIKGGNVEWVSGVSLPIITLGKLASGYRIIDGSLGGIFAVPNQGAVPDAYGGLGHDIVQDIPGLNQYKSAHANAGISYSNAAHGWIWGGTLSYAFGGSTPTTTPASN